MVPCPRCGNDAEYLGDDVFALVRCEFCGENLDAADLVLRAMVDRLTETPPASAELPLLEPELV
jgi:tRNA(Ile2) C34 agmatinyltransferase TiaS